MIVVQFAGFSGSGKTRACLRIAPIAAREGKLGYLKSHHGTLERAGSDTQAMEALAALRILAGSDGALHLGAPRAIEELLEEARALGCDIVLVEGYKSAPGAKAWLRRSADDAPTQEVRDVAFDLLGTQAVAMPAEELWRLAPRRSV